MSVPARALDRVNTALLADGLLLYVLLLVHAFRRELRGYGLHANDHCICPEGWRSCRTARKHKL
jgi:hypothetical protein